jgi:hypothetical protein
VPDPNGWARRRLHFQTHGKHCTDVTFDVDKDSLAQPAIIPQLKGEIGSKALPQLLTKVAARKVAKSIVGWQLDWLCQPKSATHCSIDIAAQSFVDLGAQVVKTALLADGDDGVGLHG